MAWHWSFSISAEGQNLRPRSGATRTPDRFHTAYAVGYFLAPCGLAGLCPAGQGRKTLVAHALLRAASSLRTRRLFAVRTERRHECRRGTQECVRHIRRSVPTQFFRVEKPSWRTHSCVRHIRRSVPTQFFMKFRWPQALCNRPGGLTYFTNPRGDIIRQRRGLRAPPDPLCLLPPRTR